MLPTIYHNVLIPMPDIFSLSGRDVFNHLGAKNPGEKNLVVVPIWFVEEIDRQKGELGEGAVDALMYLKARIKDSGQAEDGMKVVRISEQLDLAFVDRSKRKKDRSTVPDLGDLITKNFPETKVRPTFITNDPRLHIELGLKKADVGDPEFLQVKSEIVYEGIITGNDELLAKLYESSGKISLEAAAAMLGRELFPNQFLKFEGSETYVYARVAGDLVWNSDRTRIVDTKDPRVELLSPSSKKLKVGGHVRDEVLGVSPRDMEQYLAMQYGLLNPDVSLMFLCGSQGSGKTLLGYVTAVDQVLWYDAELRKKRYGDEDERRKGGFFRNIVLLKPTEILGGSRRDIGALPGSLYDKIRAHLEPYIDAHEESVLGDLFSFEQMLNHPRYAQNGFPQRDRMASEVHILDQARLSASSEMVKMTYSGFMRGRSFRNTLIVIDEAQNFTPYEVKTIAERAGEGSKVIVMGDPLQTDNPHCSREINGLTHAIKHYLAAPYSCLVTLTRNYRSQLSEDAGGWKVFAS